MWSATVARTERNEDKLDIIVTYTDGTNEFAKTYSADATPADSNWLQNQIQNQLNKLSNLDNFEATVKGQNLVSVPLTVDPTTLTITDFPGNLQPISLPDQPVGTI